MRQTLDNDWNLWTIKFYPAGELSHMIQDKLNYSSFIWWLLEHSKVCGITRLREVEDEIMNLQKIVQQQLFLDSV